MEFSEKQINQICMEANRINADNFKNLRDSHFEITVNYNPDLDHRYGHYPPMGGEIYRGHVEAVIKAIKEITYENDKKSTTTNKKSGENNG